MMITVIAKMIFLTISAEQLRGLNGTFYILYSTAHMYVVGTMFVLG